MDKTILIAGIPKNTAEADAAIFRSRLFTAYCDLCNKIQEASPVITMGPLADKLAATGAEIAADIRLRQYSAVDPSYTFEQLILPEKIKPEILNAIQILNVEELVFDTWGLRKIEPYPKTGLNFYGPPGTGKTMAAHAIANFLSKKIMIASYAEIESKYHGDGPKNVKALFSAAEQANAVLFIDEADSLLSKRLLNVTQGSEQAINSMRSQLLINLEQFHGVVIFATNLIQNYDKAFETRVRHIEFPLPDESCRKEIWRRHLPETLPLADDVSIDAFALNIDDICGRDIKNAVIQAATKAALAKRVVNHGDILSAIREIKSSRIEKASTAGRKLTAEECAALTRKVKKISSKQKRKSS